ncbi:TadE/TadG family type IV pilus assembly protein [Amnibacterium kyonggiense]|uniref:TadE-like protein n=1 Tax=Amnibacterium kyonggiense TaxID=595671 RepID=A0A4R7FEX8_9MICO|nr:TadE/TadG family type IV pilus assembly protein [Amnibacterium kyonggiense]TDS75899.1 TadE-like protein [Amnibacterium kyonggiense]
MIDTGERGSAPAEFVLTAVVLLALVLGVLQLGAALLVRNTALDAVAEGARWSALVGNSDADGVARARQVLTQSLGSSYAGAVTATRTVWRQQPATEVRARIPLPLIGLFGPPAAIEVTGHAALEPEP